ncbi:MAG: tyrosine-type recombinase/integrase [bacterium]
MNEIETIDRQVIENMTIKDLVEKFISSLDVKESSRKVYNRQLRPFIKWLDDTNRLDNLNLIKRGDILQFKRDLQQTDKSINTINSYLTAVRKFFKWLQSEKIYPNIAEDIKSLKKPKGHQRDCLTIEQVRQALNSIDTSTLAGKRNFAIFNLLVRTGLRTIEIARGKVGDIRQKNSQAVLYIQGKGRDSKDDFVLLTEDSLKPIRAYLKAREQEGEQIREDKFIFTSHNRNKRSDGLTTRSIRGIIKSILKNIGLNTKRYTAHSLRHTAITLAIQGGASIQQTQAMARHSNPQTTMIYYHNLDRVENGAEKNIKI